MPPVDLKQIQIRDGNASGRNFPIIFGVIASAIMIMCLGFGFFWPKHRERHLLRASPTRHNAVGRAGHNAIVSDSGSPSVFPSHPAVRRGFRKQPSGTSLQQYDPRTETPFPNLPIAGESISLSCMKLPTQDCKMNQMAQGGGGLSTPARDRLPSRRGRGNNSHSIIATNQTIHPTSMDCSLAIPEPLLLRARPAGKPPPLRPQLAKFPLPKSGSSSTGNLTHPNKLFQDLDKHSSKSATVSQATPSPASVDTIPRTLGRSESPSPTIVRESDTKLASRVNRADVIEPPVGEEAEGGNHVAMEQTTGSERSMVRMQSVGGQVAEDATPNVGASAKKSTNSSTELFSDSTISTKLLSITPPTSPLHASEATHSIKSIAVMDKAQVDPSVAIPTRISSSAPQSHGSKAPPSPLLVSEDIPDLCSERPDHHVAKPIKSKPSGKARPARLKLEPVPTRMSFQKKIQRHSMSSLQSMLTPLIKTKRPSIQASSIYSRDTRGVSYMQSPIATIFGDRSGIVESSSAPQQHTPLRKTSSLELLKCKIDNWNLDIDELQFPLTPSYGFKRAVSNAHVRSPTFPGVTKASLGKQERDGAGRNESPMVVPAICVARASDDIFRDPVPDMERGRVLRRVLDMEMAESASHYDQAPSPGSAPGGSGWI